MSQRRLRFTIRKLMLLVAVVAVFVSMGVTWRRRTRSLALAAMHEREYIRDRIDLAFESKDYATAFAKTKEMRKKWL